MFSLRIVTTDHYQATPLPDLDVEHSEFRGSDVFKVPVIRVYGSTPGGQKTCMHVHGVFPYLYVPYDGTQPWDRYLRLFASSLDKAVNVAQGHPTSNIQHVYKITLVSGIPMYGYHETEEQFLKIYLYNPGLIKKVADLLLGGAVMNQVFQPHESHIPYTLQMFIDYNLYGMNMLNLAAVKFRRKQDEGSDLRETSQDSDITTPKYRSFSSESSSTPHDQIWDVNTIPRNMYVGASRQSTCELEVDAVAADILNRLEVDSNVGGNPGLAALWEDEKQRRRDKGESSQITPQDSQDRDVEITESDEDQQEKFRQLVLQLQPYIDSQSESDDGSQKEELYDVPPTPASQVELHFSQRDDMSGSSQDTVVLEEEDQAVEPVISLESIQRVISFSQSFQRADSQPSSNPLDDTQDRSLAQILAALADESSPPSSQTAAAQVLVLEEQDSILHDRSVIPDEKLAQEDEEETLEMSQVIGIEEEEQEDESGEHEESFDLAGIDDTWTDSQIQTVDNEDDDSGEEDKIPQFDGAADEKPAVKPKSKKRLGVRGPVISGHHPSNTPNCGNQAYQGQGHLSYQDNMSQGHMMYGGGNYGSSHGGNANYVGYKQQQAQQYCQQQHHIPQHQQTHQQQHRQQQQHLGQSHQSHSQGLNINNGNDLSGNYMNNMYGNNNQRWGQTFPINEQQQQETGGYGRMGSWGSYDAGGNQEWSNPISSVQRSNVVQSPTQHHPHSTLNSPVETLQNINSPPTTMDSPQGMLHSPTTVLQSAHSTLPSPDTNLQSPHSNMQSPQSTIQSPPSAIQSPQPTIQSPNHTSTQPNTHQPLSSPGMSSTGSRTPMASPPLPNFRGSNSQEYPASYQHYNNYPGGTYNTMDYNAQPPTQNIHGGYNFGSQQMQQQYYHPSPGHQSSYNQSNYYRSPPNTYLPNSQSRGTGAMESRTQINFAENKNNFKRKLKQKLMEKQLSSKPLSPTNLQSPALQRNKGTVSFPSQKMVNCNATPQKSPHKPQSQLEKLLMADDDDSQTSQDIGQRSLSRCSNTSNASSSRGSEKPHPPQSSNPSSVSSFSPLSEMIRGSENGSLKFSSDSTTNHESSQQTRNSFQSISGRQNSLNGSSDDLFFDTMSQPSSSNTSMFNDLFNPDNLSPPSFQPPPENRELRTDGNLSSPNFQGDSLRSPTHQTPAQPQNPFSQVMKKNSSSFSSLESLENLVSSVQRNSFYGVNVDQQEIESTAHKQHSQGLARSHLNSQESTLGLQNVTDYTDLQQGGHINISQSHEQAASRHTNSSQSSHQHGSEGHMPHSYRNWNMTRTHDGVNIGRSHDNFTQQLTSTTQYQNTQNTPYMKTNLSHKTAHTLPQNYSSGVSRQGHIRQYHAQISQSYPSNHNMSSSSNHPTPPKALSKVAKLNRSLSVPTVPKKRGRPRKCDSNLAAVRNRSNSVILENKPLTYNPAYTFAFHVPSPVFKRLKFHKKHPPNDYGIKVVRMHPKDARKYSLMKIGREIVKLQNLTSKQIAEHAKEIVHHEQKLASGNTELKPAVLDDKTGVMVTLEKCENEGKDSEEGTCKNLFITESENSHDMCKSPINRSENDNGDTEVSIDMDTSTVSSVDRNVSKNGESEADLSQHDKEISRDLPHDNNVDIHKSYSVDKETSNFQQKEKYFNNSVPVTESCNEHTEKETSTCGLNSVIESEVQCVSNTSVQSLRWNGTNFYEETDQDHRFHVKEHYSLTEMSESHSVLPSGNVIKQEINTDCERTVEKVQAKDMLVNMRENSDQNPNIKNLESNPSDDEIMKKICKKTISTHEDKNYETELYTEIRSTMLNNIIEKVLFHSAEKEIKNRAENTNVSEKITGNMPITKCSTKDSNYILNKGGIGNIPTLLESMSGQKKKRRQKRCLSTKKRLKATCNGHSFPPVVDPDRDESNNVVLKDVNLTEASEGKLTPIRGHTPIAGRSPIRMNTNLEQYRLFDADLINNKEELESKLKLVHPDQDPVECSNKMDGNVTINEKDECIDSICDSPVSSVKSLSSRTSSRKDSSESGNSGSESWKAKLSMRKRKSSSVYSNRNTGCRKSLRQRKEKSFFFENSGSELDCVFEKEFKNQVKKRKKVKEIAGIDYIVIGRFKGHTSMRVGLERLDIDTDESVNVSKFIADQVRKGDTSLQKPLRNQETTKSMEKDTQTLLRKAQSRTPAFELFTKLQNEAFGEEKVAKEDDKSKEEIMDGVITERNTDDSVAEKQAVDFDEDSNESLKDCQMEDNESDSGSGESKPLSKRIRSRRGSRRKLTRNQKLHVAFLGKRTRRKKSLGNIGKLLNSLSLLHDATIANLNDSSTISYHDACKTEDFKVKYEDAMFKMSFLSSSDSDRGGSSPPHPLSPEELARDQQGSSRSTSDVQSPVLSASENSLSPAHHCVPYHQKECSVSDLRSSPIYPFTVTNHKLSSGIFQNCSSEDIHSAINLPNHGKIYSSSDRKIAHSSPPPPLLNIDNHGKPYKRDGTEQVYCTQGGIDIKKAAKAIVKLKPLSNKDIEQYCGNYKSNLEKASGSLHINKHPKLVSKNISSSIRDFDVLYQKEVFSNDSTSSPPDLGPPNIPKYPSACGYLDESDLPPPLLIHRSPRSQKPDFTGYGIFESSFSKSPASCCSSGSLNVVHSDRFSDISEDEEDDGQVMTENICEDTCLHTSSAQSYLSPTVVINSTHDLPSMKHESSINENYIKSDVEKTNSQKSCTEEKTAVINSNNTSHDNTLLHKTPEQSENMVDSDSIEGLGEFSDNTSGEGGLFNGKKELMSTKRRILTPSILPPSRKAVQDTAAGYGLNTGVIQPAYCSNPEDLPEQPREQGGRVFKVQSYRVNDLIEFEGMAECEGLKTWREIMMAENRIFSTQDENETLIKRLDQEPQLRFAMMGDRNIIISPCKPPPGRKEVERWAKGRKLWKRLKKDNNILKIDKNYNINKENPVNLKGKLERFCGTNETPSKSSNNMISKTRVNDYNDSIGTATAEVADDIMYHSHTANDVGNEQKHLTLSDSINIVNMKKDGDVKMKGDGDYLDNNEDIISPSPPSGQRLTQFTAFDQYRQVKSSELNPDYLNTSTPTRVNNVEFKSQQVSSGDQDLTNTSTPSASNRLISLSQGGRHSTPIQRKRLTNLFGSAFTPIKSAEKELAEEKLNEIKDSNKMGTPQFALPRKIPLPRRQSSNSSDCLQRSLQASQLGQFATPVNKKGHVSQIDAPTPQNSFGFKVSQQNLQNAKALHEVQNLTVLSMELHAECRVDLRPDPEVDPILAIFYSIFNDVSPDKDMRHVTGAIIVDRVSADCQDAMKERSKDKHVDIKSPVSTSPEPTTSTGHGLRSSPSKARTPSPQPSTSRGARSRTPSPNPTKPKGKKGSKAKDQTSRSPVPRVYGPDETVPDTILQKSGVDSDFEVTYVREEAEVFSTFLDLVARWDPDIFVGYEIQNFSWGFLLHRAAHLSISLASELSRIPEEKKGSHFSAAKDEYGADYASEIHVVGRIVLNLWRLLRHEVTLNIYSFENVTYHVLHQRIPHFSFKTLNLWFNHKTHLYRWRVMAYYLTRVKGNLQIMEQLDLIGRTSEFARVFGIEFYDVLSRGSQYRVESMMLRLAKPLNYIPVSPSVHQRARMRAPECIALTLEPESQFYADPVVVVDFQSLYPSIMIAHNYCFCTCLGRLKWLEKAHEGSIEFGCTHLKIPPSVLKKLQKDITVSPNGVVFVKEHIRKGVISAMVEEILNTRIMVKKAMKEHKKDKGLHRLLDARQLGLKLIANVTYGYTGANFSGRMPCVEVADSIVRKARETLEKAIKLVEDTPRWGARVVYGDTDSMFIELKGRSKDDAFKIGYEICDAVTAMNPKPMKLKFEKVYLPCILQTKKRYVGFSYETPDQKEPIFDAKGIETVRRDACAAVSKILEKCIKILFTTRDVSQVKQYVENQCRKAMEGKVTMQDFIFAKEYRGLSGYKPGACVPALEISRKLLRQDRRAEPRVGERVPYVIVYGPPGLPLIQLVRQPRELLQDPSLRLNATYYITKQILPPLDRIFSLMGVDVFSWYNSMPKFVRVVHQSAIAPASKKGTISHYFSANNCPVCDEQTNQNICNKCMKDPQTVCATLNSRMRHWDKVYTDLKQVCNNCMGVQDENQPCISLDCPILFRRTVGRLDANKGAQLREVLEKAFTF